MTQVLGISFDGIAAPSISLKPSYFQHDAEHMVYGWGYGWYPDGNRAATLLKDATTPDSNSLNKLLKELKRFHSTVFICHLLGAAKHRRQQDTQPFSRSYAGRDWIMLHNGNIENYKQALPLSDNPIFEPLGTTDSEHVFCWLMSKINEVGARHLKELDGCELMRWLQQINNLGTANIMLSDGVDLLVYHDQNAFNPLLWSRRHPPYTNTTLESEDVAVDLSGTFDVSRTMIVFATQAMSDDTWVEMQPGQALLARRGWIQWDNHIAEKAGDATVPKVLVRPKKQLAQNPALLTVYHETKYNYQKPIELSKHLLRLKPVNDEKQQIQAYELIINPDSERIDFMDVFGNSSTYLKISEPYKELTVLAKSTVLVHPRNLTQEPLATKHQQLPLMWLPWQQQILSPYLLPPELPATNLEELQDYAKSFVVRNDNDLLEVLSDINTVIYQDYSYASESTDLNTTPYEVYAKRRGVCQDFANLFICLTRLLNIPARYRTGYIYTGAHYENKIQSDASHAWIEVYIPFVGWRGYDPTNGVLANTDHIKVACGRNYRDATPTSGTIYEGGGKESLSIEVRVEKQEL